MTGVPADTFRAWERRHGVPRPFRSTGNQRLYSDLDVGAIRWLRDRTDEGMTISNAVRRLRLEAPAVLDDVAIDESPAIPIDVADHGAALRQQLLDALTTFDGDRAERTVDEAIARYSVEAFCEQIVEPVMTEIGDRWSRGEISVAVEHFSTQLLTRRLAAIYRIVSQVEGRGTILAACPAGEEHDLGLMVMAIMLSRRGWQVIYLGANVPADDLISAVGRIDPDLICLSATNPGTVAEAVAVATSLQERRGDPLPIALGGPVITERMGILRDAGITPIVGSGTLAVERVLAALEEGEEYAQPPVD